MTTKCSEKTSSKKYYVGRSLAAFWLALIGDDPLKEAIMTGDYCSGPLGEKLLWGGFD